MSITMYSTESCPRCKILATKLTAKNINFTKCMDINEMQKLGIMSVPVLKVNDKFLNFNEANSWVNSVNN